MVRKSVFTREDVVAAGLAVVDRDGLAGLSARRVADELGASTAPVYSNFANMDELGIAVRNAVTEELLDFTARRFTDDEFLNIGIGVLEFARHKPGLYSAIFMEAGSKCEAGPRVMSRLVERVAALEGLVQLPESERVMLLYQMANFTHGLAGQICAGLADPFRFEDMVLFLADAGDAMTRFASSGPERTAEQQALIAKLLEHQREGRDRED